MNADEQAFFRAMGEADEDDTPRLAYADWLEEHGDADRARFIRLQVELYQRQDESSAALAPLEKEEDALFTMNCAAWTAGLPKWAAERNFTRGFPRIYDITGQQFLDDAGTLRKRMPIYNLSFEPLGRVGPQVFASKHFAAVRSVDLREARIRDEDVVALAASRHARNLHTLELGRWSFCDPVGKLTDAAVHALAASRNLTALRKLDIGGYRSISVAALTTLIESKRLAGLNELELHDGPGGVRLAEAFASDRCQLRGLTTLSLWKRKLSDAGVAVLASSPHLGTLTELILEENQLTDKSVEILCTSPTFANLQRALVVSNPKITKKAQRRLDQNLRRRKLRA